MIETQLDRNLDELHRLVRSHLAAAKPTAIDVAMDDVAVLSEPDTLPLTTSRPESSALILPDTPQSSVPVVLTSETSEFAHTSVMLVDTAPTYAHSEVDVATPAATISVPNLAHPMLLETSDSVPIVEYDAHADRPMFFVQDRGPAESAKPDLDSVSDTVEQSATGIRQVKKKRWWQRFFGF